MEDLERVKELPLILWAWEQVQGTRFAPDMTVLSQSPKLYQLGSITSAYPGTQGLACDTISEDGPTPDPLSIQSRNLARRMPGNEGISPTHLLTRKFRSILVTPLQKQDLNKATTIC